MASRVTGYSMCVCACIYMHVYTRVCEYVIYIAIYIYIYIIAIYYNIYIIYIII